MVKQLVFMDRGPVAARAAVALVLASGCGLAGWELARLHEELAARVAAGASLNPLQSLLASGSSLKTAWPGWVAAVFFAIALLRLRRGPPEPAAGRAPVEALTPAQLRSGLRREYLAVRILLVTLLLVAAIDVSRAIATTGTRQPASTSIPTYVEAAGYMAAALVLAAYAAVFAADLRRLGAI